MRYPVRLPAGLVQNKHCSSTKPDQFPTAITIERKQTLVEEPSGTEALPGNKASFVGCKKKKKKSSSTAVISMTRLRCITATFRKTKMVAQSSGTENASGSKYHSFDTTVAPVSGRIDETNLGIVGIKLKSLSETLENSLDGAARQSGFDRGNGTT